MSVLPSAVRMGPRVMGVCARGRAGCGVTVLGGRVRQVEDRSVVEQVTHEIRRSVVSGDLRPGQEFSLREIAAQLGVSFIPVREALRVLDAEGLVISRRGRSAVVAPLEADDLAAIYQLRRQIEPDLAARSCARITESDLVDLRTMAATFGDHARGIDDIYDAHHAFHLALLAPAATAWDTRILETLWHAAERYVRVGFGLLDPDPEEHDRRAHAHTALIDAFTTRDHDQVRDEMTAHLDRNETMAQRAIADIAG